MIFARDFCIIFIFDSTVSQKMDHFDISFACSIFSKSWEVTNYGFLGAAHLPVTPGPRREPRKVSLQAFSGAKCTVRRAHDLCHPYVRDEEAP